MARREDGEMLLRADPPAEGEARSAAARPRVRGVAGRERGVSRVRVALRALAAVAVVAAALYGWNRVEQFLIRDPRFALNGTDGNASTLEIHGVAHASPAALEAVFREDSGRSVYVLPLSERRAALRAVDWVKDASVARLWPNRVLVRVSERAPVAFVTLAPARFGLIDEDGVILPPATDRFHLPVLAGVRRDDSPEDRRKRVGRMMSLLASLGPTAAEIAEVDVSDPGDLKVKQPSNGRMVTLLLGDRNFAARYRNFTNHYDEIREKLPGAATLDLRLEDRITVVDQ